MRGAAPIFSVPLQDAMQETNAGNQLSVWRGGGYSTIVVGGLSFIDLY